NDQLRLGDQRNGMAPTLHHFKQSTRNAVAAFYWLIDVGDAAEHYRFGLVAWFRELALKQLDRIGLHKKLGFKIQPWRQAHIGVVWACVTIDAAVFAAPVRID